MIGGDGDSIATCLGIALGTCCSVTAIEKRSPTKRCCRASVQSHGPCVFLRMRLVAPHFLGNGIALPLNIQGNPLYLALL